MSNVRTCSERITPLQYVPRTPPQALTSTSSILDAEEVRGSNPLAPTSKGPGHRAGLPSPRLDSDPRSKGVTPRE